jgi:ubiquinone/menaquinone biosynthesis C-methylase UbiE
MEYVFKGLLGKFFLNRSSINVFSDFVYRNIAGVHPKTNPFHHQWAMNRILLNFSKVQLAGIPPNSSVLDVGVGSAPYWYLRGDLEWLGLDVLEGPNVNFVLKKDSEWPIESNSIDQILCTQVLEHVENPKFLVSEVRRVLKPGGTIILNAPFLYPFHGMPNDQARYTTSQLEYYFKDFEIRDIGTLGNVGSSLATIILNFTNYKLAQKPSSQFFKVILFPIWLLFNFTINIIFVSLDYFDSTESFPLNTYIIASRI